MEHPQKKISIIKKLSAYIGLIVGALYIFNPGAGLIEAIPDTLPIVGNIDETFVVVFIIALVRYLRTGTFVLPISRHK